MTADTKTTTTKPLCCFHVRGGDEPEDSEIIFARSSVEAKRCWANEHGDGERYIAGISARRCKQWDEFAPGPVPALEMIEAGWWFECHGCNTKISNDSVGAPINEHYDTDDWALDREYGQDTTLPIMAPVELPGQRVWCTQVCCDRDLAKRAKIKRWEARLIHWMERRVLRRFPGATLVGERGNHTSYAYVACDKGHWTVRHIIVSFSWPTMKIGPASFRLDSPYRSSKEWRTKPRSAEWMCCSGDRQAFETYAAETQNAVMEAAA